jgi:hypothetical protein
VIADFNIESGGYWTDAVYQEGSSVYFTVSDDSYGPTWGDWWNPSALSNTLFPLVMDEDTGELFTLQLNANKVACGSWWGFNTGQSSEWNCDNIAALSISEEGNELLQSGHSYISPGSSPLIVQARRWHQPNASQIIEEFALSIKYTVP